MHSTLLRIINTNSSSGVAARVKTTTNDDARRGIRVRRATPIVRAAAFSTDDADADAARVSLKERLSRAAALSALVSTLTSGVAMDAFAAANAKKSAAPMDVEEMYEASLKVEDLYARATDQYSDGVNPLADDKDSYESWNWKALVDESGATTKSTTKKRATTTKAPRPAAKKKAEKPAVSDATLKAQAKQRENAEKLERAREAQAERDAAAAAKKKEAIAARDAAQNAAVEARRAAARAAIAEREQQAAEEIAERQAARQEQRARMDKLREKSEAERKAEQREFAAKQRAAIGNTKKSTATKKKTNTRRAASGANKKKPTAYKKRTTTPKKKYGGSLDRNSFRNVKRQRGGSPLAAPALLGAGAYIYYLLLQEEED